ncbi:L-threonylcarbamoyladenylate synthase [Mesoplasma seiffertii]|uniref:L-threonylcarbamoyladenylate synthase n=1 Tax=Mesoplasma seiffertii TaxID=28224 RepID=UPI0004787988|nr:Sua5/YciO/YrdC/YwlC family protein [Mesoplasma seiffertii]
MLSSTQINQAITALKNNEIIILPTDTIYGLSAIVQTSNQIRINELKQAEPNKPLIILFSRFEQIEDFDIFDRNLYELMNSPIPTTVIIQHNQQTYALRKVIRKDLQTIIDQAGVIYSTSVNIHGQEPLRDEAELKRFSDQVKVFFDEPLYGEPSKIYNSVTKKWVR